MTTWPNNTIDSLVRPRPNRDQSTIKIDTPLGGPSDGRASSDGVQFLAWRLRGKLFDFACQKNFRRCRKADMAASDPKRTFKPSLRLDSRSVANGQMDFRLSPKSSAGPTSGTCSTFFGSAGPVVAIERGCAWWAYPGQVTGAPCLCERSSQMDGRDFSQIIGMVDSKWNSRRCPLSFLHLS